MSTSVSRRSSPPVHPTRQQLEELDALLKRMLDLPVNAAGDETETEEAAPAGAPAQAEAPPAASPPEAMRGPHHPALARPAEPPAAVNYQTADTAEADLKPRLVSAAPEAGRKEIAAAPPPDKAVEGPQGAGDWVPLTSSWRPSARTWKPLSDAWRQAQTGTGAAPVAPPWMRDASPTPPPEPMPTPPAPPRAEAPPPPPVPAEASPPPEEPAPRPVALSPRALEHARRWKPVLPARARKRRPGCCGRWSPSTPCSTPACCRGGRWAAGCAGRPVVRSSASSACCS